MIQVDFFLREGKEGEPVELEGFRMKGHALFDVNGRDVVCAGVSALATATLNALTDLAGLKQETSYQMDSGFMEVTTDFTQASPEQVHDGQLLYRSLLLNMEALAEQFPDNIHTQRRYRDDSV